MAESTQHKLDRVRPPRVQITYDVEIGNAIEKKELPLVVGILADLSGKPDTRRRSWSNGVSSTSTATTSTRSSPPSLPAPPCRSTTPSAATTAS